MKFISTIIFATILGISFANAQTTKTKPSEKTKQQGAQKLSPDEKATKISNELEKELSLSADQKKQVYDLAKARATEIDAVRAKYKGDQKSAQPEIKAIRQKYKTQMDTILTPEQKVKFDDYKKKKRAEYQEKKNKQPSAVEPEDLED
jgi:Spy/CpxP family protein refolding chaperone